MELRLLLAALAVVAADSQCQNGGKLLGSSNSTQCICPPNYSGQHCEQKLFVTCLLAKISSKLECACDDGFEGKFCEKLICSHGNRTKDGLSCHCDPGWTGLRCEQKTCENGRLSLSKGLCICDDHWVGKRCQSKVCVHGRLRLEVCRCFSGWTGSHCHKSRGICDHGTWSLKNITTCVCEAGWEGRRCDQINCRGHPFGVRLGGQKCHCFPPYSGKHCELCVNEGCPGRTTARTTARQSRSQYFTSWLSDEVTSLGSVVFVFLIIMACACCQLKLRQRRRSQQHQEDLSLQPTLLVQLPPASPLAPRRSPTPPLSKPPSYRTLNLDAEPPPPSYEESLRALLPQRVTT